MNIPFWIALKYLKGRRKNKLLSGITFISILGIMVGVMALTVVLSVMDGFEKDLKEKIIGVNSHIVVRNQFSNEIEDYKNLTDRIMGLNMIEKTSPYITGEGLIMRNGRTFSIRIRGVIPEKEKEVTNYKKFLKKGSLKKDSIAIGSELAKYINVSIGDKVRILSPQGSKQTPIGIFPRVKVFNVSAIFESKMYEYDTSLIYLDLETAKKFLNKKGVSGIGIKIKNINKAQKISEKLNTQLGETYIAKDWFRMNQSLYSAMQLEKKTMFVILSLIVLVASFNIIASLITLVKEKTKEIGILRSLGFNKNEIRKIFLYNGMIIGGIGTLLGEIAGLIISLVIKIAHIDILPADVYYSTQLQVSFSFWNFFLVGVVALLITYGASIFPSFHASKLDVVEALRYE